MKKVILFVLLVIFISFNADATGNLHIVQPKDTLWALSKAHYKNPFLWGKIWVNNTYLNDPNLIFPGEVIQYTKHGITIYKPKKHPKRLATKKTNLKQYDGVVFYDGSNYYSDCGGGFCIWHKFSIGTLSYDRYNALEVSAGSIVYVKTRKPIAIKYLYVYRGIKDYQNVNICPNSSVEIYIPIGKIKIIKRIEPLIYKGVIENSSTEISSRDTVSTIYPFKNISKNAKFVKLGNIPIKLIGLSDVNMTPHIGYYAFFKVPEAHWQVGKRKNGRGYHIVKLPKPFTEYIVGKKVFVDRINKNLPENTRIGEGIVVSQYKGYISVFFDSYNSGLKEIVDETKEYVLR